jgi:hypothetical protein
MGFVKIRLEEKVRPSNTAPVITELGIGNFKAFGETQRVPIKPLTLIFGANSSGKSSIIHGLLLARHALDTGHLDVFKTQIGGDSVDLGGIRQYVHRGDTRRCIEFTVALETTSLPAWLLHLFPEGPYRLSVRWRLADRADRYDGILADLPAGKAGVVTTEFSANEAIVWRLRRDSSGTFAFEHVSPVLAEADQKTARKLSSLRDAIKPDATAFKEALPRARGKLRFSVEYFLPLKSAPGLDCAKPGGPKDDATLEFERLVESLVTPKLEEAVISVARAAADGLQRLRYLGPLRCYPMRHSFLMQARDENWIAGGGYAWEEIARNSDVCKRVNAWLSSDRLQTKYRLSHRRYANSREAEQLITDALREEPSQWRGVAELSPDHRATSLVKALLEEPELNHIEDLVLLDERSNTPVYPRDVGIGVSQVLPVLVHAFADQEQIVVIEQPEIHLHPALQAELGDVFIESALGPQRNTFLLETHSEHLILRVLRQVRDTMEGKLRPGTTPVRPEDVSVIFVEPTAQGSIVRHLPVTPDGDFAAPWPGGFFAERLADLP